MLFHEQNAGDTLRAPFKEGEERGTTRSRDEAEEEQDEAEEEQDEAEEEQEEQDEAEEEQEEQDEAEDEDKDKTFRLVDNA